MNTPTYRYQVDMRDPATGEWAQDGRQARGILTHPITGPETEAARILRVWTADAGSAPGPWRVRLWTYSATYDGPNGDLVAEVLSPDEYLTLRINTTFVSSLDVIAALLHFAADQVRGGNTDAPLYDSAGNQVGSYRIGPAS